MTLLLAALAAVTATSSDEARSLGRKLAEVGTLAALLPLIKEKETAELLRENAALSSAEKAKLRDIADRTFAAGYDRLMSATGDAYAKRLSIEDLRALVSFHSSPTAARYRAATPEAILASMQAVGNLDFKGDVRRRFCAETQKLCAPK